MREEKEEDHLKLAVERKHWAAFSLWGCLDSGHKSFRSFRHVRIFYEYHISILM